ncbi:hypothetical protein RJ639_031223, partial [Escallonia herrerae]
MRSKPIRVFMGATATTSRIPCGEPSSKGKGDAAGVTSSGSSGRSDELSTATAKAMRQSFGIVCTCKGFTLMVDDVCDLSQCDDEVRTPRENEGYENFDNFDNQLIDGKTFDTLEAAYDFYNQYALLNGFGTRKHNAHKIRATGAIEGFKKLNDKRPKVNEKRLSDLRTGCEAMMQVTLSKKLGMWVVNKFQDVHNHPLTTTPSKVIKHHSHSKYHHTNVCKSLVSDLNHEGLKASYITRVVNVMKPSEEAGVTPRQCSSIIRVERKNNKIGGFKICTTYVHIGQSLFIKDTFFAGMTKSGRSESIHSFFDGY